MPILRSRDSSLTSIFVVVNYYESFSKVTATYSEGAMQGLEGAALARVRDVGGACVEAELRTAAA